MASSARNLAPLLIDGSLGEGGGQILRSALALSMITSRPFRMTKIRAGRPKPGLLRQHLTAVNAAVAVSGAEITGATLGSKEIAFTPGTIMPGDYAFAVGTAGSATLVMQTVLPALLAAGGASNLTLEGGTHNSFAPPFDFVDQAFLPLLNRMGANVHASLERAGFYPAGGGRFFVSIAPPGPLAALHVPERGAITRRCATAYVAALSGEIALRELDRVRKRLGWADDELHVRQLNESWGPGNALTLALHSEHVTEVFTGFGARGTSAEAVAENAIEEARGYLASGAAVGPHLADQLLLPMALAAGAAGSGGAFTTQTPTQHTRTNAHVIASFLDVDIEMTETAGDRYRIAVKKTG